MKTKIVALLMLITLVITACTSNDVDDVRMEHGQEEETQHENAGNNAEESDEEETSLSMSFEPTSSTLQHWGFVSTARVYERQYFFTSDNEVANTAIVYDMERIIEEVIKLIVFEPIPLEVYIYDESAEFSWFDNGRSTFINPNDINYIGRLINRLSDMRLPIWLCVGVEAYARAHIGQDVTGEETEADSEPIALFGDMIFAPVTWGSAEQLRAINTAYDFVSYLIESGGLEELTRLYFVQETTRASEMAAHHFYEFAGMPMEANYSLHFEGNSSFRAQEPRNLAYDYRVTAHTDFGIYHFLFMTQSDDLSAQAIRDYVSYFDDSVRYVLSIFSGFIEVDYRPIDTFIVYNGYGGMFSPIDASPSDVWIRMVNYSDVTPSVFVHETTHFISFWAQDSSWGERFRFEFEEGLAMAMMSYHDMFDRFEHGKSYLWAEENRQHVYGSYTDALYDILGDEASAEAAWEHFMMDFDSIGLAHVIAYHWLYFRDYESEAARMGNDIAEIGTHPTAGSFVLYLIESFGLECYMQVHLGQNGFEDVYGKTIHDMIAEWRAFLDDLVFQIASERV